MGIWSPKFGIMMNGAPEANVSGWRAASLTSEWRVSDQKPPWSSAQATGHCSRRRWYSASRCAERLPLPREPPARSSSGNQSGDRVVLS